MSLKSRVIHQIKTASKAVGGAYCTKGKRAKHGQEFIDFCASRGWRLESIAHATDEMLVEFVAAMTGPTAPRERSSGTIQNKLSSIRVLIGQISPHRKLPTNAELRVPRRPREGKKEPIPDELFDAVLRRCIDEGEYGMYHVLRLQRLLGLRGLESLMSTSALKKFMREALELLVQKGTKGGLKRTTTVISVRAEETVRAIEEALAFAASNGGFFIVAGKDGLKSARSKYHRLARELGLAGKHSPHSCRYAWAVDKLQELLADGVPAREAAAMVAKWLGHGSGRGRWVWLVYCRSLGTQMPRTRTAALMAQALEDVSSMRDEVLQQHRLPSRA